MRNNANIVISFLIITLLVAAGTILYTELPFYHETLIFIAISIIIMGVIPEDFIFLYGIIVILGFGTFLTIEAIKTSSQENQVLYMYIHLLATVFLLVYWVLLQYLKSIGSENKLLKRQITLLAKYDTEFKVLTINEFIENAKMIYQIASRRNEELWLLKVHINSQNKSTNQNLKESLSKVSLSSTRKEFDIITLKNLTIFILLQNTHEDGVNIVKDRIIANSKDVFNDNLNLFYFSHNLISDFEEIINEVEGK